jgi:hypothetical protein
LLRNRKPFAFGLAAASPPARASADSRSHVNVVAGSLDGLRGRGDAVGDRRRARRYEGGSAGSFGSAGSALFGSLWVRGLEFVSASGRRAVFELLAQLADRDLAARAGEVLQHLRVGQQRELLHVQVQERRRREVGQPVADEVLASRDRGEHVADAPRVGERELVLLIGVHLAERERAGAAGVARERAGGDALLISLFASWVIPACR